MNVFKVCGAETTSGRDGILPRCSQEMALQNIRELRPWNFILFKRRKAIKN